jgi:hypothetical protein
MPEKMNIYQKLQKCRVELQKSELKKSGRNTFSNYDYFELGDFLPRTNELLAENNLIGIVSFSEEQATLTIRDTEKPEDTIIFTCPNAEVSLKGAHPIQNIGALQTYQRRYLWITAMELSEHDAVDRSEGKAEDKMVELTFEDVSKQKMGFGKHKGKTLLDIFENHPDYVSWFLENGTDEKIKNSFEVIDRHMHAEMDFEKLVDETKIATIRGLLAKTDSSESEFLKFYKLERLEDMTIDTFTRAMKALEKKLEKIQKTDFTGTPFEELPI